MRSDQSLAGLIAAFSLVMASFLLATACSGDAPDRQAATIRGDGGANIDVNQIYAALPEDARQAALRTRQRALETLQSGRSLDWQQGEHAGNVQPERSYRSIDGSYCRHFIETLRLPRRERRAVACRSADGIWQIAPGSG